MSEVCEQNWFVVVNASPTNAESNFPIEMTVCPDKQTRKVTSTYERALDRPTNPIGKYKQSRDAPLSAFP